MREFKGTSGKWWAPGTSMEVLSMPSQVKIVKNVSGDSHEEAEANRSLIAAAPDLLKALQELAHLHSCEQEGLSSGQPTPTQWLEAVDKASVVIGQALGEE